MCRVHVSAHICRYLSRQHGKDCIFHHAQTIDICDMFNMCFQLRKLSIGRVRLKSPGLIWGAPIPVLTNRKYLPIVDKKCALDRSTGAIQSCTDGHCSKLHYRCPKFDICPRSRQLIQFKCGAHASPHFHVQCSQKVS